MFRGLWLFTILALPLAALWAQNEADIYRDVSPSVVSIKVETSRFDKVGGAGFVIDEDGHIVTNAHVVKDAKTLTVEFHDGYETSARMVGIDTSVDLAVIKIDTARHRLKPLTFGDSDALVVGETVLAIGSPLGFDSTLTRGIISGLNRNLEVSDGATMEGAIQTDAMLAPGNSGGPLVNQAGEVIGINAAGYRGTALGFAIPSNLAWLVAESMILAAEASATREALTTTEVHGTANAMIATANAMIADADERATEPAMDDTASVKTATPTETIEAGEGTFSDPTKQGWQRGDGDGRWIGVDYFTNEINEKCRRPRARCKELTPGNEFIGVMVYAKCDESRRTRCEFNLREFEVAGTRGIPYSAEYHFYFDTLGERLLPDAIMPGSSFEGLVVFEVPRTDDDFRFGWTPSYGWDTVWFAMSDLAALAATQAAERRATDNARETARATEVAAWRATHFAGATARAATANARKTAAAQFAASPTNQTGIVVFGPSATDTLVPTASDTPVPTNTNTPAPTVTRVFYYVYVDDVVNLRSGPGTNYSRVGVARPGDTFAVIGYKPGIPYHWLEIRYSGGTAWIAESFTRLSR
ncbi:MAG: trypsin-like peptidase domain-containing protein [Chloroflexi bacterium]|nr:trypsin-like peptidase domain-containing protein [Chloroflexota bacterium]